MTSGVPHARRGGAPYPGRMEHTPDTSDDASHDLVSALEVIEAQPLAERAAAYEALHDTLARRLDSGPAAGGSA